MSTTSTADPIVQWERWYDDASTAGVSEPNAMVVATTDSAGRPDARFVLVRGVDDVDSCSTPTTTA